MGLDRARIFGVSCVAVNKSSPLLENDGFSIEFWIRTMSTKGGIVLDKRGTVDPGDADWWISYVLPGGQGRLQFHYGATGGVDSLKGMLGVTINDGVWRHVALVWNSSSQLTWWVDGEEAGSTTVSDNLPFGNTSALTMGCDGTQKEQFDGDLDEVRVSTYARYKIPFSPPQRHYRDRMTRALWHLDEGPGDIVTDATGNGYDGFGVGGVIEVTADVSATVGVCCGNDVLDIGEECDDFNTTLGDGCGSYCDAEGPLAQKTLLFNGSTGCIDVPGDGMLTGVDSMTVEFWIKTTASNAIVFDRALGPFVPDWRIFLTGAGNLAFHFQQQFSSVTAMPIADGTWHHALVHAVALPTGDSVCMTGKTDPGDAECTRIQWYVDGEKSGLAFSNIQGSVLGDDLDLRVGCAYDNKAAYSGLLDEIRIQTQVGVDELAPFEPATVLVPNDSTALLLSFDYPSLDAGTPDLSGNERQGVIQEPVGVQLGSDNP
jgi:cysteine-rich repeat protein